MSWLVVQDLVLVTLLGYIWSNMPIGTKVDKMYRHLLSSGYDKKSAAKIAQAKTGLALKTGKPPKREIK